MLRKYSLLSLVVLVFGGLAALANSTYPIQKVFFRDSPAIGPGTSDIAEGSSADKAVRNGFSNGRDDAVAISSSPTENEVREVPEYILYGQMFELIVRFERLATEQRLKGEDVTIFQGYFGREAGLGDWQSSTLTEVAHEYVEAVKMVDDRAERVIKQLRATNFNRESSDGNLIQPSAELLELQHERDELALKFRDRLRARLTDSDFRRLDNFVLEHFAEGFRIIPVTTASVVGTEGGEK